MTKAEMAAELTRLTGEEVNPDDATAAELQAELEEAKSGDEQISVRLGTASSVGSLSVGDGVVTRQGGTMTRADYDRLKAQYGLEEVKG